MIPFEAINTAAAIGTFLVVAATAIAAIIQLRHLRASNQLEGLLSVLGRIEDDDFNAWFNATREQLPELIEDPAFRETLEQGRLDRNAPWVKLANSYDAAGNLIKNRLLPEGAFLDNAAYRIVHAWEMMQDLTVLLRRRAGPGLWENFEYLYVRSKRFIERHPNGNYPRNERRVELRDRFLESEGATTPPSPVTLPAK